MKTEIPPNVLLIMVDEMQAAAMSCANHPFVKTPNLDKLAARGCRFTNAFTPSPICVPARASFATGQYVHRIGYWDNAIAYDGRVKGWGHILQENGLKPTSIGKLHYRTVEDDTGFHEQILPMHILEGIGQVWGSVRDPLPETRREMEMIGTVGEGLSKYNEFDLAVARETEKWLQKAVSDSPWVLFSSFVAPHFPLIVPGDFLEMYPPNDIPLPSLRLETGYKPHPWQERMTMYMDNDAEFGSDEERQLAIACYFALCTFVDSLIGRILDVLEETDQARNTLVIFCSDHGECLGQRGRWGKSVLYCESTRVPMIIAGAGIGSGQICSVPVSLIDVAPTILDAYGIDKPEIWAGKPLQQVIASGSAEKRMVFSEYHAVASPSGAFMVTDGLWKYHEYVGYPPELFNLEDDPMETSNLADKAEFSSELERMRIELHSICNPTEMDALAKSDQNSLTELHGGRERALKVGTAGATPVPI